MKPQRYRQSPKPSQLVLSPEYFNQSLELMFSNLVVGWNSTLES